MKHTILIKIAIFFTFILMMSKINAQNDSSSTPGDLVTDRPDQTESPTVVPKGFLQVETGAFFEDIGDGAFTQKAYTFNTTLLRYGLLDNLELRIGWDYAEVRTEINGVELDDVATGLSPLLIGFKVGITEEKGLLPEIGFLGAVFTPFSAGSDFRTPNTGADFRFSFAHTLSEKSSFSYNLGVQWDGETPEAAYAYTVVYGYAFTDKLGAYAELYGDFPENSSSNHNWDAGLTYLINDSVQLDATVGSGISTDQNVLLSAGVSFRIPN